MSSDDSDDDIGTDSGADARRKTANTSEKHHPQHTRQKPLNKKQKGTKIDFASVEDYASLIDKDEEGARADRGEESGQPLDKRKPKKAKLKKR